MPRILFTASTCSHILQFHRPYLAAFRDLGWTVDVACGSPAGDIPEACRTVEIPFEKQMFSLRNGAALVKLRRLMAAFRYDVVSCHTSLASFFTRMAVVGLPRRPKVVCTAHGYLFGEENPAAKGVLLAAAEKMCAPVTDLLMTMNGWDTRYAVDHKLGRRIAEIPGIGLDAHRLDAAGGETREAVRQSLGVGAEDVLLLYAAEFSQRKSQQVLVRAMTLLPHRVKLALPGQGALWEETMSLAKSLGLEDRVFFPGQVSRIWAWFGAADIAVSASRSEGLPFNLMEAMYCGLPVVASRVKGHTDLLDRSGAGLLYPYGDWRACAEQVQRLILNPGEKGEMGRRGREAVRPYCLDSVLPQVMAQYAALIPLGGDISQASQSDRRSEL